ncbi:TetR/AcrR family transcriptional regulator [Actinopolymorpha pittospori]|uniref:AcrR family transcriptional regulator n=1 Tax=Actinopolymorpha pittospori TaxID=648752 RepID=A0A927N8U7_9ACTN|nr:TetR/AcrR family transcriptional regulator [Actinopolymorpha pittospori]MBE1611082.1 AcrR family transcriptional regulator [Actinopolymorpha pittospori]
MAGRRSDTRERIQQVALELFSTQGYEQTSLREVAERLRITRPALYYHFRTKEDILSSVLEDLGSSIEELVQWGQAQPRTARARRQILHRIAGLLNDQWRPLVRFSQVNQTAMKSHPDGARMQERMLALVSLLSDPDAEPAAQFEARLAVVALFMGTVPFLFDLGLTDEQRSAVALEVAGKLVADPDETDDPDETN